MYAVEGDSAFIIEGSGTFPVYDQNHQAKSLELHGFDNIADLAFQHFTNLVNVSFNDALLKIGNDVFFQTKVENVYLPSSLQEFSPLQSFDVLYTIKSIKVSDLNRNFKDIDGVLFSKDQTILYYWPPNRNEKYIVVPNGVELIWIAAFAFNSITKYVRFPPTVRTIQNYFFTVCNAIEYIEIQNHESRVYINPDNLFRDSPADRSIIHFIPISPCNTCLCKLSILNYYTTLFCFLLVS